MPSVMEQETSAWPPAHDEQELRNAKAEFDRILRKIEAVEGKRLQRAKEELREAKASLEQMRQRILELVAAPKLAHIEFQIQVRFNGKLHIYIGISGCLFGDGHGHYVYDMQGGLEYRRELGQSRHEAFKA